MVGGAPQVLEHQQQTLPQSLSAAEEEAVKRNTDCVYFLASPLTCKKGSECEYRHSEYARVNPRDCWFWLNGNCLNPKCSFRHPPLDGLVGSHAANPGGSQTPQTSQVPSPHNPFNSSKQAVPCIFFQKGLCLKGDRCAFLHGPPPASTNKVSQTSVNVQAGELPSLKKVSGGTQVSSLEQKVPQANLSKSVGAPPKLALKDEFMPSSKTGNVNEKSGPSEELDHGGSRYKVTNSYPILNEGSLSRAGRMQQSHESDDHGLQNGKDVDEFLKESSPGFDVLVDDELRDSGYYGSEEQFGRTRGHDGTNMIPMNEYDRSHSADYNIIDDVDQDVYNDVVDYEYDSRQGLYGWEHRRMSSEKMSLGSTRMERRLFQKSKSPDHVKNMDLRHRLNKQRRVTGLRSVINNDHVGSRPAEENNYRPSGRDSHPPHESSISSRLHGRINFPRIPSPVRNSKLQPERRQWGRNSLQGSIRDETKARVEVDYNNERRTFNDFSSRRERERSMTDGTTNFAAPKRLAELKGEKHVSKEHQTLGKRKGLENNEQSVGELSFDGPKPLSEILKKKRQVEAGTNVPVNNAGESREIGLPSTGKQEFNSLVLTEEESKSEPVETVEAEEEKISLPHSQSSQAMHTTEHENEDGTAFDEPLEEDHEFEADGEYEYEQVDDGEYHYEGDNVDPEEEYMEDEDGDDFAKKIGVMS